MGLPLLALTQEQYAAYRPIWGEFLDFEYVFAERRRVLALCGLLAVSEEGQITLEQFFAARSCRDPEPAEREAAHALPVRAQTAGFAVSLLHERASGRAEAFHLILSYANVDHLQSAYLAEHFPLSSAPEPDSPSSHFYPVSQDNAPDAAEAITAPELARRLRGKRVVAFTGAGISLSSGVPTFRGAGGLEQHFPLFDRFPGLVAEWMLARPEELARVVGCFQASFITAQPNAAHRALAELERRGLLVQLITGNKDRLHERAGSRRVHGKDACHFVGSDEGWAWIREGEVLLVAGVFEDEHGLLSYAREHGLQIAAVGPEPPVFLHSGDWFTRGRAEEVLPELVA